MMAIEPGQPHTLEYLLDKLTTRTRADLGTLHFVAKGGRFSCLDLSLEAATLPELAAACGALLETLDFETVLPAAPEKEWRAVWSKTMVCRRVLPSILTRDGKFMAYTMVQL